MGIPPEAGHGLRALPLLLVCLLPWALGVSPLRGQNTHVVLIAGLGGDQEYTTTFHGWLSRFADAASERYGVDRARITYFGEKTELDPTTINARSTADNIRSGFAELAEAMTPEDDVVLLMVGHGTFRDNVARFNIPGPDLTPEDLDGLLDGLGDRQITVINTATASGPFLEPLSGPKRTIIVATKSGREQNLTRFGLYFVDAFAGDGADLDKDTRVSMLEAFTYAVQEVAREYEGDGQILTEHALLDDNGDGEANTEDAESPKDGALAGRTFLASTSGSRASAAVTPALQALYDEKSAIEARIEELRVIKGQIPQERYEDELENLLVELALKNREIRSAGESR